MKNSVLLENLKDAYNATFTSKVNQFGYSDLLAASFGRILNEVSLNGKAYFAFTIQNEGKSWATFICPCDLSEGRRSIPCERKGLKVTVLLHWGMNFEYLDDLTTWGHEKCSYKIDDVDYSVVEKIKREHASNYYDLFDAVVQYKDSGEWYVDDDISHQEREYNTAPVI